MDAIIVTGNRIGKRIYDSRDAITRPHMIVIFGLHFILCENIVVLVYKMVGKSGAVKLQILNDAILYVEFTAASIPPYHFV